MRFSATRPALIWSVVCSLAFFVAHFRVADVPGKSRLYLELMLTSHPPSISISPRPGMSCWRPGLAELLDAPVIPPGLVELLDAPVIPWPGASCSMRR